MENKESAKSRRAFVANSGAVAGLSAFAGLFASNAHANSSDINAMGSTPEQLEAYAQLPSDRPIVAVNLLKFSDKNSYEVYQNKVASLVGRVGAEIIFSGDVQLTRIGGADAEWDRVLMIRFPNTGGIMEMVRLPEYREFHKFRAKGLEGQVNLTVFENEPDVS